MKWRKNKKAEFDVIYIYSNELEHVYFTFSNNSSMVILNPHLGIVFEAVPTMDIVNQWWPNLNTHNKSSANLFPSFSCTLPKM